ncbi:MAG: insulinase family protein [bacterium]|nr:insulinase family protein [bacterium]
MDRTQAPALSAITEVNFVSPITFVINKHVNLYHMPYVPNDTARFDLYFDAGKIRNQKSLSSFVNGLLFSGTKDKTSVEINADINRLGGFLDTGLSAENAVISMYCLKEHLPELFDILFDAITNVSFREDEVADFLSDRKQKLHISREKVSYLAQSNFQKELFASDEKYATILEDEHFSSVTQEDLKAFHENYILNGLERVVVIGNIPAAEVQKIASKAGEIAATRRPEFATSLQNRIGSKHVEKEGALQSAIRVGRTLFNKNHPDFLDFFVLNTILGDYFGSRLMSNIREDKGYTYGIGSMIAELNNTGYFLIATEVGKDVREKALQEIRNELDRLCNELVSEQELDLVRNYMRGQLLKSADGPYAMTDLFLSASLQGKDLEFYNDALLAIHEITPERIQELANKYLRWDQMTIVTAG